MGRLPNRPNITIIAQPKNTVNINLKKVTNFSWLNRNQTTIL